jgi:hypothetical protein
MTATKANSRFFFGASLLSNLGSSLTNIALAYQFLLRTENVSLYATLIYAATITGILISSPLGARIDLLTRYAMPLLVINTLSAICSMALAASPDYPIVVMAVVLSSAMSIANLIIIKKSLPLLFCGKELHRANVLMTEIAAIGAAFGPLAAPILLSISASLPVLYTIDAITFLIAALAYWHFFKGRAITSTNDKALPQRFSIVRDTFGSLSKIIMLAPKMQVVFVTYIPYIFAFAGLFFTLAIFNKEISFGNEVMFAIPIISMLLGRMCASHAIKNKPFTSHKVVFAAASFSCMVIMLIICICNNMLAFIALEFLLGIGISMLLFSQAMWLQTECPIEHLGSANGILRTIESVAKLLGVPIVAVFAANHDSWLAALCIGLAFGISSVCALLYSTKTILKADTP